MDIENYISWYTKRYRHTSSVYSVISFIISDFITIMLCIGAGFFIVNLVDFHYINFKSFVTYWVYLPFFLVIYNIFKLYPGFMLSPSEQIKNFVIANGICFGAIAISIAVETDGRSYVSMGFILGFVFSTFSLPLSRNISVSKFFAKTKLWGLPAVIYGEDNERTRQVVDSMLKTPRLGYVPAVIVSIKPSSWEEYKGIPVLKSIKESIRLNTDLHIKMAVVIHSSDSDESFKKLMQTTLSKFRYNIIIPNMNYLDTITMSPRDIDGIIGFSTTHYLTRITNRIRKRSMDLFLLIAGSVIAIPAMIIIAVIIKASSPGPVFFKHNRIGQNGKKIKVLKFRSMFPDADKKLKEILDSNPVYREEWEKYQKLTDDPRITPIGKFLRKTSLDELPQIWNILKGEMSFIGPRPVTAEEVPKYGESFDYVFSVKPGLSGMWQVSGRSDVDYDERISLDSYYIQNWSIWMDIWLIAKTIFVILSGKGAR